MKKTLLFATTLLTAISANANTLNQEDLKQKVSALGLDTGNVFVSENPEFKAGWNVYAVPFDYKSSGFENVPLFKFSSTGLMTQNEHLKRLDKFTGVFAEYVRTGFVELKAGNYRFAVNYDFDPLNSNIPSASCKSELSINGEAISLEKEEIIFAKGQLLKEKNKALNDYTVSSDSVVSVQEITKCHFGTGNGLMGGGLKSTGESGEYGQFGYPGAFMKVDKMPADRINDPLSNHNISTNLVVIKGAKSENIETVGNVFSDNSFLKENPIWKQNKFEDIKKAVREQKPEFGRIEKGLKVEAYKQNLKKVGSGSDSYIKPLHYNENELINEYVDADLSISIDEYVNSQDIEVYPSALVASGYFVAKEKGQYVFGVSTEKTAFGENTRVATLCGNKIEMEMGDGTVKTVYQPNKSFLNNEISAEFKGNWQGKLVSGGAIDLEKGIYKVRYTLACNLDMYYLYSKNQLNKYSYVMPNAIKYGFMIKGPTENYLRKMRNDELFVDTGKKEEVKEVKKAEETAPSVPSPAPGDTHQGNEAVKADSAESIKQALEKNVEIDVSISFETGKADLDLSGQKAVAEIAKAIKDSNINLVIEGHTDDVGDDKANMVLSEKRANAVKQTLAVVHGIDETRLETKAFGETKPRVADKTEEGRKANRRTTIYKK